VLGSWVSSGLRSYRPAARIYRSIYDGAGKHLAAGEKNHPKIELLRSVDKIIDDIHPFKPFDVGRELCGSMAGVYWIAQGRLHIFYGASKKPLTVAVLAIWDGPTNEVQLHDADILCTQMILSGKVHVLSAEMRAGRAAAN
jgi:hypothetical protein